MSLRLKELVTDTESPWENYLESNYFESNGEVIILNALMWKVSVACSGFIWLKIKLDKQGW
jgi:hypothetical protein